MTKRTLNPIGEEREMKTGIGLPAAVPGVDATTIGTWAAEAEKAGFASVGVIDRLVYDNLEPLTALAAAAARTERVELFTTVLNVGWRANPVLLAKQMASVDLLSGRRLTAGLGLGGWPEDFAASTVPTSGGGARLRDTLATMRRVWAGELSGQGGPMPRLPEGRPGLLFGGLVPAAHRRAATEGQGWVAPLMSRQILEDGSVAVRQAWADAGRAGEPRIVTGRYFSLGPQADAVADEYIRHYYGDAGFPMARADTLTSPEQIQDELDHLAKAGVTDLVLYPSSADLDQLRLLPRPSVRRRGSQAAVGRRAVLEPPSRHGWTASRGEEINVGKIAVNEFVSLDGIMAAPGEAENLDVGWTSSSTADHPTLTRRELTHGKAGNHRIRLTRRRDGGPRRR